MRTRERCATSLTSGWMGPGRGRPAVLHPERSLGAAVGEAACPGAGPVLAPRIDTPGSPAARTSRNPGERSASTLRITTSLIRAPRGAHLPLRFSRLDVNPPPARDPTRAAVRRARRAA
jgi:hypothetical protein